MMLAVNGLAIAAIVLAAFVGAVAARAALFRRRAARLAVWKQLRNGMTPDEVRGLLGEPRRATPLEDGEKWDYSPSPSESSVLFTYGRVSGYVKPL